MAHTIKVKRHGLGTLTNRKVPFRMWLNEQPRKELTYREVSNADSNGWTCEDFALEAIKRGVDVRVMTVAKWSVGTQPREIRRALERAFKGIRF